MSREVNLNAGNPRLIMKGLRLLGSATSMQLAAAVEKPKGGVDVVLKALHQQGMLHISGYETNKRGDYSRVYTWGRGEDVPPAQRAPFQKNEVEIDLTALLWPRCDVAAAWLNNEVLR